MQRGAEGRALRLRAADLLARLPVAGELLARARERRALGGARVDPGRRGARAMVVVAVLVFAGAGLWVWSSRPHRLAVASAPESAVALVSPGGSLMSPLAPSSAAAGSSAEDQLVIDVAGKVRHPGVYRLPAGSRVDDAVTAAGGMLAGVDPASINLAAKLSDGQQVVIGAPVAAPVGSADSPSGGSPTGLVDLNTATADQLDALPGVGPVLAQRIVDYRTQHGRFASIDQLQDVSGIGDSKYSELKSLVTVS